ncbi:hypothetical protein TWF694_007735 [Orbilia ellipsospora]|uniref:Peptidase S33 tripeptidyl aminopeptidase-like C-terminal domain-containing protein n=1 Tax=Orbilia ellipsospora TaxID=2528407 RepID=A0AAV9XK32_9PEZI
MPVSDQAPLSQNDNDNETDNDNESDTTLKLFDGVIESPDLKWYPCKKVDDKTRASKVKCAKLTVPLDYKNPGNGLKATIPIVKYLAAKGVPYKGSILFNPGGPGALGTESAYDISQTEQMASNITGPGWDILGFDPRGIGYSTPHANCTLTDTNSDIEKRDTSRIRRFKNSTLENDKVFGLYLPRDPTQFTDEKMEMVESGAASCATSENQAARYMNTPVVATDMLSIAKALAREKGKSDADAEIKLNYYGMSYGTILGQYFASLYPANVGRFVLDAVADAEQWISNDDDTESIKHADEAFSRFFPLCFKAGPKRCTFAEGAKSTSDLINRFNNMTIKLNAREYEATKSPAASIVERVLNDFYSKIFMSLYAPHNWWQLADWLVKVEELITPKNPANWPLAEVLGAWDNVTAPAEETEEDSSHGDVAHIPADVHAHIPFQPGWGGLEQVKCSDSRNISGSVISPQEEERWYKTSRLAGSSGLSAKVTCIKWQVRPAWEWYGPIGGSTATPILFVGNHLDPVTPFESAERAAKLFKGAQTVYVDEIGHTVLGTSNTCAMKHAQAYFQDGTLPGPDTRCKPERQPFEL